MEEKMKIILVKQNKKAEICEIENTLENMQKIVEGYIETLYISEKDEVVIVCNEEGALKNLPVNRILLDSNNKLIDVIKGDFFIAYAPREYGDFKTMPQEFLEKYLKRFETSQVVLGD